MIFSFLKNIKNLAKIKAALLGHSNHFFTGVSIYIQIKREYLKLVKLVTRMTTNMATRIISVEGEKGLIRKKTIISSATISA